MEKTLFKQIFDEKLHIYLKKKIQQAKQTIQHTRIEEIIDHTKKIILWWWKRIRPYGFVLGYSLYADTIPEEVRQFAITFELLHSMALIHDDVIDQADKRHNVHTIQHFIRTNYPKSTQRIAEWQAILVGDILLARVYENMIQYNSTETKQAAIQIVHNMIQEVILWQMIDVDLAIGEPTTIDMIEKKNLYKTARYTFARPMTAGAIRAQTRQDQIDILHRVGESLWLAFQMRDDLIDITESEKDKNTFYDIQTGQQTLLTQYIQEHQNNIYAHILQSHMGKVLDAAAKQQLKEMFVQSWAIDFAKKEIQKYTDQALKYAQDIQYTNKKSYQNLEWLIAFVRD